MTGEFALAVHALVFLNHKRKTVSSEMLAENICTNPARVRKVMAKLKKAGLIRTKEGMDGGYAFVRSADEVNLRQIDEAVDVKLVSSSWRPGDKEKECLVSSGMGEIMDTLYQDLDELCRVRLEQITIADIDRHIFHPPAAIARHTQPAPEQTTVEA